MDIEYRINHPITAIEFTDLLSRSRLGTRRPINDSSCMQAMVDNANLIVTAWDGDSLVGLARSLTDFHYACYLSELAVDSRYQRQGIGRQLQEISHQQLGPRCNLIVIAAPNAADYYAHLGGYERNSRCWVLSPGRRIGSQIKKLR